MNHLVSGYNGGKYPYGLGDASVHTQNLGIYSNIIEDRKRNILLLQSSMTECEKADDKADMYKYCRLLSLERDRLLFFIAFNS